MHTLAILAPDLVEATPAQKARAQRAVMEQMMLLARGLPVDSLPVRCAAELVGSALASGPVEYELAPVDLYDALPTRGAPAHPTPVIASSDRTREADRDFTRSEAYGRYMRTIMSTRPT